MNQVTQINEETGEVIERFPIKASIVKPAVSPREAVEAWREYEALKKEIITPEDIQTIQGKDFLKKSYWKKCATFFNLSVEKIEEHRIREEDGSLTFETTYRAIAPNGRFSVGDGACNTHEKKDRNGNPIVNSIHNTRGTANTRASNRAISNLVGGGEVSAEEADQEAGGYQPPSGSNNPGKTPEPPASAYDPNWLITFGKFAKPNPKKIGAVPVEDLESYVQWLETDAITKGKPLEGNALKLKQMTELRVKAEIREMGHKDYDEPPPYTDEDMPNPLGAR